LRNSSSFLIRATWRAAVSRCREADFLSRFRRSPQVFDISHESSVLIIAKEEVGSVTTGKNAGTLPLFTPLLELSS